MTLRSISLQPWRIFPLYSCPPTLTLRIYCIDKKSCIMLLLSPWTKQSFGILWIIVCKNLKKELWTNLLTYCLPIWDAHLRCYQLICRNLHWARLGRSGRSTAGLVPTAAWERQAEQFWKCWPQSCEWYAEFYFSPLGAWTEEVGNSQAICIFPGPLDCCQNLTASGQRCVVQLGCWFWIFGQP